MMELIFLKQYFRFCQSLNQQVFCFVCDPAHSCAGIFRCCCTLIAPSLHPSLTTFGLPNPYALFQHDFSLLNRSKISIHNTHLLRRGYFLYVSISYPVSVFWVLLYICNTKREFHPANTDMGCIAFVIHSNSPTELVLFSRLARFIGPASCLF